MTENDQKGRPSFGRKVPELLAPAGGFESAYYAFEGGADAVYLGLRNFSARKFAENFSLDQLRRLLTHAHSLKKSVYIAVNTLFTNQDLKDFLPTLLELQEIQVSGLILQDLGVLRLLRKHCPDIPIHASTQFGIHNYHGVAFAQEAGFSRIVLARELELAEIAALRRSFPEMEMEVFIHGALCFGFSGYCLASGIALGRSANRGSCAQVCRTWSTYEGPHDCQQGKRGYYFSANDLALGDQVVELADIGIDSLKIEGRMKGPNYTLAVCKYYRYILDCYGNKHEPDSAAVAELKDACTVAFSRRSGSGHFFDHPREKLINQQYPSHLGKLLGHVEKKTDKNVQIKLETKLAVRDGVLFLQEEASGLVLPVQQAVKSIGMKKKVAEASAGSIVTIELDKLPKVGVAVFKVSAHDSVLADKKAESFQPLRKTFTGTCSLSEQAVKIDVKTPYGNISISRKLDMQTAKKPSSLEEDLQEVFFKSGNSEFAVILSDISVKNTGDLGRTLADIFVPKSVIKTFRNFFFE